MKLLSYFQKFCMQVPFGPVVLTSGGWRIVLVAETKSKLEKCFGVRALLRVSPWDR